MDPNPQTEPVEVRYYPRDGSVFLDTHYLIKGVAGAIFWKLACEHIHSSRTEFSTRELRLAGEELHLPDLQDNLCTRLILLQRRLAERNAVMQIHKAGRGRYRMEVRKPLRLLSRPVVATALTVDPGSDSQHGPQLAAKRHGGGSGSVPRKEFQTACQR